MSPDEIQAELSSLFCPPLDTTLVAAISHEPGQTLQSAKEVCETLAIAAVPDDTKPAEPSAPTSQPRHDTSIGSRRQNFGGKLTGASGQPEPRAATKQQQVKTAPPPQESAKSSRSASPADVQSVERLLEEWSMVDSSAQDPENLRLTDEETDPELDPAYPAHALLSKSTALQKDLKSREADEGTRLGEMAGNDDIDPIRVAEGTDSVSNATTVANGVQYQDSFDPLLFLKHAFPGRTATFLRDTLNDAHGDIQTVIDTIMTIDVIEAEDARQATLDEATAHQDSTRPKQHGLDYEALARGISSSQSEDPQLRGKKRRAARKRMQDEQRLALGAGAGKSREAPLKVNLTDLRHGGPTETSLRRLQAHSSDTEASRKQTPLLSDADLAAKLAAEEEGLARDPNADQPVLDNQWLLTSSVLSQLSMLLDVEPSKVTSVYNASSFKLAVCFARLLEAESDRYPSLSSLDEAGNAPDGTAQSISDGIAAIAGVSLPEASIALRATKGRQDAALDLLQLHKLVKESVQAPDALDPLGHLTAPGAAEVKSAEAAAAKGFSVPATSRSKTSGDPFPTPSQSAFAAKTDSSSGGMYSNAMGRKATGPPVGAAAAFQSGGAIASVFPASSAFVASNVDAAYDPVAAEYGLGTHVSSHDPLRRMAEYRLISEEYRARRDEALRKAGNAWKSGRGGTGGKTGDGGRGGVAWHYADEARKLDAKARAWSLRASRALVDDRRIGQVGVLRPGHETGSSSTSRYTIDLHGVNVHEGLSIVRENVTKWYASPGTGLNPPPLRIITGVGRHSPHQIAVLRPAIAKMLDREGWRYDVDHHHGIITVRGTR